MKTMLTESAFSITSRIESQTRRPIAIGAMLATAWLSAATALANGSEFNPINSEIPESQSLQLHFADGLLTLNANQRCYEEVLGAIEKETGIRLHYPLQLPESITESFTALPVKLALERLFGPEASLIFRYAVADEAPAPLTVPKEVWVIGTIRVRGTEGLAAAVERSARYPGAGAAEATPNQASTPTPIEVYPAMLRGLRNEEAIDDLLRQDEDPEMRLQALAALSQAAQGSTTDKAIARSAIEAALSDKDAQVRGQALQALTNLVGAEAMPQLWQALRDPDPGVRIQAIESAGSGEQGKPLLEEALSDENESVRAVARARLAPDALEVDHL